MDGRNISYGCHSCHQLCTQGPGERGTKLFLSVALILTKESLFASSNVYNVHILLRLGKIMRNKASRPENMKNKYDENMSKSTALPDMNTIHDVTSP